MKMNTHKLVEELKKENKQQEDELLQKIQKSNKDLNDQLSQIKKKMATSSLNSNVNYEKYKVQKQQKETDKTEGHPFPNQNNINNSPNYKQTFQEQAPLQMTNNQKQTSHLSDEEHYNLKQTGKLPTGSQKFNNINPKESIDSNKENMDNIESQFRQSNHNEYNEEDLKESGDDIKIKSKRQINNNNYSINNNSYNNYPYNSNNPEDTNSNFFGTKNKNDMTNMSVNNNSASQSGNNFYRKTGNINESSHYDNVTNYAINNSNKKSYNFNGDTIKNGKTFNKTGSSINSSINRSSKSKQRKNSSSTSKYNHNQYYNNNNEDYVNQEDVYHNNDDDEDDFNETSKKNSHSLMAKKLSEEQKEYLRMKNEVDTLKKRKQYLIKSMNDELKKNGCFKKFNPNQSSRPKKKTVSKIGNNNNNTTVQVPKKKEDYLNDYENYKLYEQKVFEKMEREELLSDVGTTKDILGEFVDRVIERSLYLYKNRHCHTCARLLAQGKSTKNCPKCHHLLQI